MDEALVGADRPRRSRLQRLAPLLLVAGAAISAFVLIPSLPRERQIELRLQDAATITGVRVEWALSSPSPRASEAPSAPSEDPIHGATWNFTAGSAPPSVTTKVRLPDGSYELDIRVERAERTDAVLRSVTLGDADRIAVPVR